MHKKESSSRSGYEKRKIHKTLLQNKCKFRATIWDLFLVYDKLA